jgi:hypothetical protein
MHKKLLSQQPKANTSPMLFHKHQSNHEVETISLGGGSLVVLEGEFHHLTLKYSK